MSLPYIKCVRCNIPEKEVGNMYAKNAMPLYEGDGYLHTGPTPSGKAGDAQPRWVDSYEIEREARRLRGEVMAALVGRLYARVKARIRRARTSALDDYLARSSSLADVERRLRDVERDGRYFTG